MTNRNDVGMTEEQERDRTPHIFPTPSQHRTIENYTKSKVSNRNSADIESVAAFFPFRCGCQNWFARICVCPGRLPPSLEPNDGRADFFKFEFEARPSKSTLNK